MAVMQLPKQFKSWVQFSKEIEGYDNCIHLLDFKPKAGGDGISVSVADVRHMALKELLAAMPDEPFDLHVIAVSCENAERHKAAKFLFTLCGILA